METKNIAAILRDKPQGTKLYSPICGKLTLNAVDSDGIFCKTDNNQYVAFTNDGKYKSYGKWLATGECLLFPSKAMPEWSKFTWKKGDVLLAGVDNFCIFDSWNKEDYTEFNAKYVTPNYSSAVLETKGWTKVERDDIIKDFIKMIKEIKCGKLNLETLEIEKPKPQFEDGDVVAFSDGYGKYNILIFERIEGNYLNSRTSLSSKGELMPCRDFCEINAEWSIRNGYLRLATEEEKQQLFTALEKENKAWNAEKSRL